MPDLKILITGGLGYLGGRIADSLKRNHPESTIILGTSREISEAPNWAKAFQIVPLNILDPASIEKAVSNDIHAIIHLAALNEHDSFNNIESAWETNTLGTQALLSAAKPKADSKVYIFFHLSCLWRLPRRNYRRLADPAVSSLCCDSPGGGRHGPFLSTLQKHGHVDLEIVQRFRLSYGLWSQPMDFDL